MRLKKITALVLTGALTLAGLTGCSNGGDKKTNDSSLGPSGASADAGSYGGVSGNTPVVDNKPDTSKFVTVKMLVLGDPPAGGRIRGCWKRSIRFLRRR